MIRVISSIPSFPVVGSFFQHTVRKMSTTKSFQPVSYCIFDMDGLLLDTEHIYEAVVRDICKSFGKEYPLEVRLKVMGTTEQRTCQTVVEELSLPISAKEFHKKMDKLCSERFTKLDLMEGADKLIYHLHKSNIPFCLATSSGQGMAELKMSSHPELFKLFGHKVYGNTDPEVKEGKPAPDIFLIAAQRFPDKPHPSKCLVFEDSRNGVLAAVAAGMQVVMVPDKILNEESRKEATIVLDSLENLKLEQFGLAKF